MKVLVDELPKNCQECIFVGLDEVEDYMCRITYEYLPYPNKERDSSCPLKQHE